MKYWIVQFLNMQTNQKKVREYPHAYFPEWKNVCDMLNKRTWLSQNDGWIVDKSILLDKQAAKMKIANELGKLIYNN
jgi:hypothetical protein